MPETVAIAPSPTSKPALYKGAIRVAWINANWVQAGDRGTIRNAIDALGPVAQIVELKTNGVLSVEADSRKGSDGDIRAQWQSTAADMVRPLAKGSKAEPVLFISTGQRGLGPGYRILRDALGTPSLWLDIHADITFMPDSCGSAPPFINAVLPDYHSETPAGHLRVELPYLPERRNLPSQGEARTNLKAHYGVKFNRPLVAVLIGNNTHLCVNMIAAAYTLGADMVVTDSPRTYFLDHESYMWHKSARIFHEFGKSGGYNPYIDMIAAADYIATDGDSYSLPSDVMALGKPVAIFGPDGAGFVGRGFATKLNGADTVWHPPPPHERPGDIINRAVRTELAKLISG